MCGAVSAAPPPKVNHKVVRSDAPRDGEVDAAAPLVACALRTLREAQETTVLKLPLKLVRSCRHMGVAGSWVRQHVGCNTSRAHHYCSCSRDRPHLVAARGLHDG
jgi:hypothetical protein